MKQKILVLVDCQNDFIDGSLGVGYDKWVKAYSRIKQEIKKDYDTIIFTEDYHPEDHCSFKENGGEWPAHCVRFTEGAELYWKLQEDLVNTHKPQSLVCKGQDKDKEEYGVDLYNYGWQYRWFDNDENVEFYFCGIAYDYCVAECARMTAEHPQAKCYIIRDACCSITNKEPEIGNANII